MPDGDAARDRIRDTARDEAARDAAHRDAAHRDDAQRNRDTRDEKHPGQAHRDDAARDAAHPDVSVPETVATYLRLRGLPPSARRLKRRRRRDDDENQPFTPGRDPRGIGNVVADLTREAGWNGRLSQEDLVRRWREVAGPETAQHAMPVALADGVLTVQCDSTAWARQLRFMRAQLLTRIVAEHPDAGISDIRFVGPDVPSWKWGPRAIPGRGPRDTYG